MARAPSFQVGYEGSIPFTRSTLTMGPNGAHRRVGAARGIGRRSKATTDPFTRSTLTMGPGPSSRWGSTRNREDEQSDDGSRH